VQCLDQNANILLKEAEQYADATGTLFALAAPAGPMGTHEHDGRGGACAKPHSFTFLPLLPRSTAVLANESSAEAARRVVGIVLVPSQRLVKAELAE
jgi:hypothetical protein